MKWKKLVKESVDYGTYSGGGWIVEVMDIDYNTNEVYVLVKKDWADQYNSREFGKREAQYVFRHEGNVTNVWDNPGGRFEAGDLREDDKPFPEWCEYIIEFERV